MVLEIKDNGVFSQSCESKEPVIPARLVQYYRVVTPLPSTRKGIFMSSRIKLSASVALSTAIALGVTSPAWAIAYTGDDIVFSDPKNTAWDWEEFVDGSFGGLDDDDWNDVWFYDSSWTYLWGSDNSTRYSLNCSDDGDLSVATDGSDDQIVLCDPIEIDNGDGVVTTQLEFRFFDDLKTYRTRAILTNNTDSPIEGQVIQFGYDSYYDEGTSIYASTTSGEDDFDANYGSVPTTTTNPGDFRWVTDDRTEDESGPVMSQAVGEAGSISVPADNGDRGFVSGGLGSGEDYSETYFEVPTLQPGQTVEYVIMTQVWLIDLNATADAPLDEWDTAVRDTAALAWADSSIESDDMVFAGIEDASRVINWSGEELAETGFDGLMPLALATILLSLGAIGISRRRSAGNR